jgi:hypothetical protein
VKFCSFAENDHVVKCSTIPFVQCKLFRSKGMNLMVGNGEMYCSEFIHVVCLKVLHVT